MSNINFEVSTSQGQISTNMDMVKEQLAIKLRDSEGMVFQEEQKVSAKKEIADLRKLKKDIDNRRKEVKRLWMEPYNQFDESVKELLSMVDKPISFISEQVEAFEAKRLAERDEAIKRIYSEEIGDLEDFLPLYKIRDEKWSNASVSVNAIRKAMVDVIASVRAGKTAIENMKSDAVPDALKKYQSTLDLADALGYINRYEAQKAEIVQREEERIRLEEERKHQAELERVRLEERARIAEEERIRQQATQQVKEEIMTVNEASAAPLTAPGSCKAVYTVVGTPEELLELETAMTSLGLYFERKDV